MLKFNDWLKLKETAAERQYQGTHPRPDWEDDPVQGSSKHFSGPDPDPLHGISKRTPRRLTDPIGDEEDAAQDTVLADLQAKKDAEDFEKLRASKSGWDAPLEDEELDADGRRRKIQRLPYPSPPPPGSKLPPAPVGLPSSGTRIVTPERDNLIDQLHSKLSGLGVRELQALLRQL